MILLILALAVAQARAQEGDTSSNKLPDVVANSRQAELLDRINEALAESTDHLDEAAQRERLDRLISDATRLTLVTDPGDLHLHAHSILMQAVYQRISRFPADPGADRLLSQLRAAARRTKAMDLPDAPAIGDFWLMTADLYDINRLTLPAEARRKQTRQLLEGHIEQHPKGPTAAAARAALDQMAAEDASSAKPTPPDAPATGGANTAAVITPPDDADRTRAALARLNEPAYTLGERRTDPETGIVTVDIRSRYQQGVNTLRILEPKSLPAERESLDVLFVLPVEPAGGTQWGDGLEALRKLDLHNRFGLLVVAPSLSATPWYADHPNQPELWQESYVVKAVTPAVDELYPAKSTRRLLLGFSRSGWGAVSLLVRWPDRFHAAAAWDAPIMVADVTQYEMAGVFGDEHNFARYELGKRFSEQARTLRKKPRIALLGYDVFRDHHQRAHALLDQLSIPHRYTDGPQRKHHWDSGWIADAVESLVKLADAPAETE